MLFGRLLVEGRVRAIRGDSIDISLGHTGCVLADKPTGPQGQSASQEVVDVQDVQVASLEFSGAHPFEELDYVLETLAFTELVDERGDALYAIEVRVASCGPLLGLLARVYDVRNVVGDFEFTLHALGLDVCVEIRHRLEGHDRGR